MSKHRKTDKAHRVNENPQHFQPPPRAESNLRLGADGTLQRLEADGGVSTLYDAETRTPVIFDELPAGEAVELSELSSQAPQPVKRLSLDPERVSAASATTDGQSLARSTMSEDQRTRLEERDAHRHPVPTTSTAKNQSVKDGQSFARSDMTAEQIKKLEERDARREA